MCGLGSRSVAGWVERSGFAGGAGVVCGCPEERSSPNVHASKADGIVTDQNDALLELSLGDIS